MVNGRHKDCYGEVIELHCFSCDEDITADELDEEEYCAGCEAEQPPFLLFDRIPHTCKLSKGK